MQSWRCSSSRPLPPAPSTSRRSPGFTPGAREGAPQQGLLGEGDPSDVQALRKQFGALQRMLRRDRQVELLLEE